MNTLDFILKCYDFLDSGDNYYLVIRLCKDGDMEKYIDNQPNGRIEEKKAIFYLQQVMNGFKELGKNKIMHRDLKPANLFLDDEKEYLKEQKNDNRTNKKKIQKKK